MKKSKYSEEQIIGFLKQADAGLHHHNRHRPHESLGRIPPKFYPVTKSR